ncbi:hypothetical protein QMY03_09615 [Arthrobacter sp. KFRI-F3372]|nr:hypothetical protein QMY03_09615 [Arthrobacter sp. KFRI-F3372]
METFWSIVFNVLLHGLLIGSMVIFLAALVLTAIRTENAGERLRRLLALFVGAMVVLGAEASGMGFAAFMAGGLASGRAASASAAAAASIVPALAGLAIGFFMVRSYRKNEVFAMRLLCFVGMLALGSFVEVYATVTSANGIFIGAGAIPNLAFAAGVVMIFIFTDGRKNGPSALDRASALWARRPGGSTAVSPSAKDELGSAADRRKNVRDPFDF